MRVRNEPISSGLPGVQSSNSSGNDNILFVVRVLLRSLLEVTGNLL